MSHPSHPIRSSRCVALVGPYLSGKTSLLESLLFMTGALSRKGNVKDGNTVGDHTPEAKSRNMSIEITLATLEYLDQQWTFIDCPGSIELSYETTSALMIADIALIVCEPIPSKIMMLVPLLQFLEEYSIPHCLFLNKIDTLNLQDMNLGPLLEGLKEVSKLPLVLRQVPIDDRTSVTGYLDLVSERAYQYIPHRTSPVISPPQTVNESKQDARQELLETIADFNDSLLEQLLEDVIPDKGVIYDQLTKDVAASRIVPIFLGSAEKDSGINRLLKALRHETPDVHTTLARLPIHAEIDSKATVIGQVFKSYIALHTGKLSFTRIWQGILKEGMFLDNSRVNGLYRMVGTQQTKLTQAEAGDVIAIGRMENVRTGDIVSDSSEPRRLSIWPEPSPSVFSLAVVAENRQDEVKLMTAISRLYEEDPSLRYEQNPDTGEIILLGQGEIHIGINVSRLQSKYNIPVQVRPPQIPYKETIRKSVSHHSRYKRQTGGHGQFADIHIEIKPQGRGEGFLFINNITGGVIPRQFIPAVENGIRDYMEHGPLGFQVVDIMVSLFNGQYHSVDSSELAFRICGRQAMSEAMPKCDPILLEPIMLIVISAPAIFTAKLQRVISARRGQILGFDMKPGWKGWDQIQVYLPQSEMHDLIIELRSVSVGVGTFTWQFDRLQELTGRLADRAVELHTQATTHTS